MNIANDDLSMKDTAAIDLLHALNFFRESVS